MTEEQKNVSANEPMTEEQIYAAHGISQDMLQGMREYKNALFRGSASITMILTFVMVIVCAAVFGIVASVTLLAVIAFATEAMLLLMEKSAGRVIRILARIFFPIPFAMIVILFGVARYAPASLGAQIVLGCFGVLLLATAVFGTIWYFAYDPYQNKRNALKEARNEARALRQLSDREKRHADRQRKKAVARLRRQERRDKFREEKEQVYEFARRQKDRAQTITQHLPGVKKTMAQEMDGELRIVEGSGKGTGRPMLTPEEATRQASEILRELERDGKHRTAGSGKAAGAEHVTLEKK